MLPIVASALGGTILVRRLVRRPPTTAAEVGTLAGWVMLVAILVAPATRIGYLVYPINFFVWAFMFTGRRPTSADGSVGRPADAPPSLAVTLTAGRRTWSTRRVNRVTSVGAAVAEGARGDDHPELPVEAVVAGDLPDDLLARLVGRPARSSPCASRRLATRPGRSRAPRRREASTEKVTSWS